MAAVKSSNLALKILFDTSVELSLQTKFAIEQANNLASFSTQSTQYVSERALTALKKA